MIPSVQLGDPIGPLYQSLEYMCEQVHVENKLRHCFMLCHSVSEELLLNLKLPKHTTPPSEYRVRYMLGAYHSGDRKAYIYAELDQIREDLLRRRLESMGVRQISFVSYTVSGVHIGAEQALGYVLSKSKKPGFQKLERGSTLVIPVPEFGDRSLNEDDLKNAIQERELDSQDRQVQSSSVDHQTAPDFSAVNLPQVLEHNEIPRWFEDFISTLEETIRKLIEEQGQKHLEEIRQLREQIALQSGQMQGVPQQDGQTECSITNCRVEA